MLAHVPTYEHFSDDLLYRKGRLKRRIELILLRRQSVFFGEGAQRALQHGNRAVNQTATGASWQQLTQALQGAQVVGSIDAGIHAVEQAGKLECATFARWALTA